MSRRNFLKLLGAGATIMAFSGLGLTRMLRFASGASTTTSTVSGDTINNTTNATTNTKFKVGAHVGTFGDSYGTDMGHNQFSGDQLWDNSTPITIDLSKPDPNPPVPYLTKNPQVLEQVFQQVQGLDVVRIFLFEENEGLVFDGNSNNKLIGIDSELVNNVKKVLDTAHKYNVQVYFVLIDCWIVNDLEYNASSLPSDRKASYRAWQDSKRAMFQSMITDPAYFSNVVLTPLLQQIKDHPALFGFDLLNEPEALTKDDPTHLVSDADVINFITGCVAGIRKIAPGLKVSVGCDQLPDSKHYASTTPISFADYHAYKKPREQLEDYNPADYDGKQLFLGEAGIYRNNDTVPPDSKTAAEELAVTERIISDAQAKGYMGALVYGLFNQNYMAPEHKPALLAWLKQFRSSLG